MVYLIPESDLNDARIVTPRDEGGYGLDAQWSDDFHHALHTLLTANATGTTATSGARAPGQGVHRRVRLLRAIFRSTGSAGTATRRATSRRGSSSCSPRTTTRSETECAASGSPAWSASSP